MSEWMIWANFALNLFVIPLAAILWKMNGVIVKLETLIEAENTNHTELKLDVKEMQRQIADIAIAAAAAAASAATIAATTRGGRRARAT